MRTIILAMLILFSSGIIAQELNMVVMDKKLEKEVLIGKCDRDGLKLPVFAEFYNEGYEDYKT